MVSFCRQYTIFSSAVQGECKILPIGNIFMDGWNILCYNAAKREVGQLDIWNRILRNEPLEDPEELEVLLELAELVRNCIEDRRLEDLKRVIRYTVAHGHYEAFAWAVGIVEELADRLGAFECALGRTIPDYEEFILRLGVDLNAFENDIQQVRDEHGEVQSFFNIIRYKTGFAHIELLSSENFDARDNDYIEYRLVCRP